ncbi:MAG: hypothetical protein JNK66_04220, partial [Chitinophagales bacterium]|nr:hypothetical protein [Chitinophagales bacterium]
MKKLLTGILFVGSTYLLPAQLNIVKLWDYGYGGYDNDGCKDFIATADGGFAMAGYTDSKMGGDISQISRGATDYWLIKLDANGMKQWDKRFGGNGIDVCTKIAQTADGGYLVAGHSGSPVAGGDKSENGKGNWDYWVVKTDGNGNKLWDKCYGGPGADYLWAMTLTKDGGALLGGYSESGIGGDKTEANRGIWEDYWVVKIDSVGNKQWDKTFGGSIQDFCADVIQTADGGYLLGGISRSTSSGDKSENNWGTGSDYWIIKIDSMGSKQWDRTLGTNSGDEFTKCFEKLNGNYLVSGLAPLGITGNKTIQKGGGWTIELDVNGNIIRQFSVATCWPNMIIELENGDYIIGGDATEPIDEDKSEFGLGTLFVRTDSFGTRIWDKTALANAGGYATATSDGCYAVGGGMKLPPNGYQTATNWDTSYQTQDFWLMKFCMWPVGISPSPPTPEGGLIQVYPNPFVEDVLITLRGEQHIKEATFMLTDVQGRVLYKQHESQLAN